MPIKKRPGSVKASPSSKVLLKKPGLIKPSPLMKPSNFDLGKSEVGEIMKQANAAYGADVARAAATMRRYEDRVRTGIFVVDLALAGGFMTSRGAMLYGEKSSGKTTTAMLVCINAQIKYPDLVCAWIDVEGTFDVTWFEKLGGDPDRLMLIEPETGEQAVDLAHALLLSKEVSVLVTDSIAMLTPMKELESSSEDQLPGLHARLIGNYIRKTNNALLKERHRGHRPINLFINQYRMKIGVVYGDPRTLPGGKALEFATSTQIETKNKEHINDKGDVQFNEHNFKITKEKTGAGRIRECKFRLVRDPDYNDGLPEGTIDQIKSILEFGARVGLVGEGRANFLHFGKFNSALDATRHFLGDPEAMAALQESVINAHRTVWGLPNE